jgi:hypothetical protein
MRSVTDMLSQAVVNEARTVNSVLALYNGRPDLKQLV